jgi:DNA-binding beta-propeller fold protein YncE
MARLPRSFTSITQKAPKFTIIDPVNLKVVGGIKVGKNPHGLAASRASDRLYVSVESDNSLLAVVMATRI